jgi:phosphoribosylglycinamide formyltransferase 1
MTVTRARIAVLASGSGSNLQAILEYFDRLGEARSGDVVLVASERVDSGALARARARHIATATLASRASVGGAPLDEALGSHRIDLVVLAGYLRLVPATVVQRYAGRLVNVHPALLPAFGGPGMYGLRVHQAVLDAGVRVTGATAHFVDENYDQGAIIAQWPVPVLSGDDAPGLAARVLRVEHVLFPRVVQGIASGRLTLERCRATRGLANSDRTTTFTLHSSEDACIAEAVDRALDC